MRGRSPASVVCPDCGGLLSKVKKGWECTTTPRCAVTKVMAPTPRRRTYKVLREARPRDRPLSGEELRTLLELYLIPSVLEQLRAHVSITA